MIFDNSTLKRFWQYTDKGSNDECWDWMGSFFRRGYGKIYVGGNNRRHFGAHRISLAIATNCLPDSNVLALHKCDNPRCVNPNHLYWGSYKDNVRDMIERKRNRNGAVKGRQTHNSTFNYAKAAFVRGLLNDGISVSDCSRLFGVERKAITNIKFGRTWLSTAPRTTI